MPKKSATKAISQKLTLSILEQFYQVVGDIRSEQEARTFFADFLTESERIMFSKRLAIALQLEAGKSYEEIRKMYGVSSATISSIAELMVTDGMQMAIQKVKTEQWAEEWATKLLSLFQRKKVQTAS